MKLVDYTDADLPLSIALETNPEVMAELGGPRSQEAIERVHLRRIPPLADNGIWLKVLPDEAPDAAGEIGVWRSDWRGDQVWEVGWMLLPEFHGRGLGSEALGMLIERLRDEPRFDIVHAFPGITNGPSNGLCRRFGFTLVEQDEVEFAGRPFKCNHWELETSS